MKRVAMAGALVAIALTAAGVASGAARHHAAPTKLTVWVGWRAKLELAVTG